MHGHPGSIAAVEFGMVGEYCSTWDAGDGGDYPWMLCQGGISRFTVRPAVHGNPGQSPITARPRGGGRRRGCSTPCPKLECSGDTLRQGPGMFHPPLRQPPGGDSPWIRCQGRYLFGSSR